MYIDGELASKCRPRKVENQRGDISLPTISYKHPVFVGGTANGSNNFVDEVKHHEIQVVCELQCILPF